jgi:hypothetical protein
MLIRISLIIAIIAGLAVAGLNFTKIKEKITTLQTNLDTQTKRADAAELDAKNTHIALDKTTTELKQTQATLASTTEERDTAVAKATAETKRADKLNDDLNKTRSERDEAQTELARYTATGVKPEEIIAFDKKIKGLQQEVGGLQGENRMLGQELKKTKNELAVYKTQDYEVPLPAGLKGKVLVADPKWNFVVLSVGQDQGVLPYGEFLVNRNGRLVAKVKVSTVQKDRSVANIQPGWKLGDVIEGDQVIPAHPES